MSYNKPTEDHLRNCILFEFMKKNNATVATGNINAVYPNTLDVRKVQRWFSKFQSGYIDLKDAPRSGRPSTIDLDSLKSIVESDPRQSLEEIAKAIGAPKSTVYDHLKEIGKALREGVWVPHQLSESNKMQRITICNSLLCRQQNESFLHRIITGDEKWILYDNQKRKRQWLSRKERSVPVVKPDIHAKKVLLSIWWNIYGIVHYEFLKTGETITADIYCDQLVRLSEAIGKKHAALVNRRGVMLQHDNAKPHTAKKTQEKIRDLQWEVLPHPPYSPDCAPSDYHLFRSLQNFLAGKKFDSLDDVKTVLKGYFASKSGSFYKEGIEKLVSRWERVVENDGDYVID